ncbi:MAG: GerAB/ArcD/ProY family transporter [Natronincolaceae bacterium]|jgi:spore germination protein KB|nr:endospore germination permease [Bacillota bacterium]NLK90174.1 endospore germination permease [Clostridiales bacterium]
MIEEGKLGVQEAVWLITIAIISKVFFSGPTTMVAIVGNADWYVTILSAAIAMIGFVFIYLLLKRFPEKDITEIFNLSLGRFFGFIFSGILALYMLFVSSTRLAEFSEVFKVYILPLSPNWYIIGFFIVSVFVLSRLGLESMARFSKLAAYPMLTGLIVVLALSARNYNIKNIYPILGHGLSKTITTGIMRSSIYGEIIILAIFAKAFQGIKYIRREGIISIGLSALIISASLLAFTLTFPYYIAQELLGLVYQMAELIDYGPFFQRIEPITLFIWIISALISITIIFYSFVLIFCKMFKIQDKKPIILGGVTIIYAVSLIHKDITTIIFRNIDFMRNLGSIVFFILPLLTLIVAAIRKKGDRQNA